MTAIYVRQSADRADSVSLETQESLCRQDLTAGESAEVYADRGWSGKNTDRPALRKMLSDIRAGSIQRVLVYKLDRISRNLADFTQLLTLFQAHHITFSSHTERFETDSPMGQAMQSLLMVFAQLERETISGRVRDAAFARAKLGFDTGGPPPFGFSKVDATLLGKHTHILSPDEHADDVRECFSLYLLANQSLHTLCAQWNAAGIRTARGNQWSANTLCRLLRNPVYAQADSAVYRYLSMHGAVLCAPEPLPPAHGIYLYADRRVNHSRFTDLHDVLAITAPHTGIITPEIWLSCQEKLDASAKLRSTGTGIRTWLSGSIFCGNCGSAMTPTRGRSQYYFRCGGAKRGICRGAGAVWRVADAEKMVGEVLRGYLAELSVTGPAQAHVSGSAEEQELETLRLRHERLLLRMTDLPDDELREVAQAAARISARCAALESVLAARAQPQPLCLPDWESCTSEERKTIAQTLLRCVTAESKTLHILLR